MTQTIQLRGSGDIRVIGPRASGKTTFMAALVHWQNSDPDNSPIQSITPTDSADTQRLQGMATDILENSQALPPTRLEEIILYNLTIDWFKKIISFMIVIKEIKEKEVILDLEVYKV